MSHKHVQQNLADYLEGDLGLEDRALVDAHLDRCVECAREVVEMQQTIRLLRLMPEPETPPMISADVMRRIRAGESQQGFFERVSGAIGRILEPSFVLPASAVAAAALVVVVVQGPDPMTMDVSRDLREVRDVVGGTGLAPAASPRVASLDALTPSVGRRAQREPRYASGVVATPVRTRPPMRASGRSTAIEITASPTAIDPVAGLAANAGVAPAERGASASAFDPSARLAAQRGASFPSATLVSSHPPSGLGWSMANGQAGARPVSQPIPVSGLAPRLPFGSALAPGAPFHLGGAADFGSAVDLGSSAGADPRDTWLERGLRDPVHFARFLGEKTLAEQELWVTRLAARAADRGVLEELVLVLQASGDDAAIWLSNDFAAEAKRVRSAAESSGER